MGAHADTVAGLAAALAAREVSSVELTAAALDRIERAQDALNAFVTIDREGRRVPVPPLLLETEADRQQAREAAARRAARLAVKAALKPV